MVAVERTANIKEDLHYIIEKHGSHNIDITDPTDARRA
jgi:hypothetical protein